MSQYYHYYDKRELRKDYELLQDLIELCTQSNVNKEKRMKGVATFKRQLRDNLARYNERNEEQNQIHYSEDGESCWYKEYFSSPFTEEEKREYIKENWIRINSPYDCTGQRFTTHIAVFNVETSFGAKSVAYHFLGLDV